MTGETVRTMLDRYYTPQEAELWLRSSHPQLDDRTPADHNEEGRTAEVVAVLKRLDEGAYL